MAEESKARPRPVDEVLASLADGLSHDLHNALATLLMLVSGPAREAAAEGLAEEAVRRAMVTASLLRELPQAAIDAPCRLQLRHLLQPVAGRLRGRLRGSHEVVFRLGPNVSLVRLPPRRLHALLERLAAHPGVGASNPIILEAKVLDVSAALPVKLDLTPGRYLAVSLTGRFTERTARSLQGDAAELGGALRLTADGIELLLPAEA